MDETKLILVVGLALTVLHYLLLLMIASSLTKIERHLRHLPPGQPMRAEERDVGANDPRRRREG